MSRQTRFQTLFGSARRRHMLVAYARTIPIATARSIRSAALLLAIWAMPATARGQIYVANAYEPGNGLNSASIGVYDAATGATINAALVSGMSVYLNHIAVSGGNLFVTHSGTTTNGIYNPGSGSIGEYTTSGLTVNASLVTGLDHPSGITVSGGNLFVSSYDNGTIGVYNATTGATVNTALVSGLNHPSDIAVSGGNLYVVNYGTYTNNTYNQGSGSIGEYTTSGATVNAALVSGMTYPSGIDVSGGNLFVSGNSKIGVYNATTGATVNAALVSGGLLAGAHDVAVSGGNLFVTAYEGRGFIIEYNATTGATVNVNLGNPEKFPWGITVVSTPLPGDYNDNGIVDAADYVVWRKNNGTQSDYNIWRTHFGQTAGSGAALPSAEPLSAAVPEPATLVLLLVGMAAVLTKRWSVASCYNPYKTNAGGQCPTYGR